MIFACLIKGNLTWRNLTCLKDRDSVVAYAAMYLMCTVYGTCYWLLMLSKALHV